MNEVIVFLWVAVFSAIAWTVETCQAHEAKIWGHAAETYAESDVEFMFSECFIVIPRPVRGALSD